MTAISYPAVGTGGLNDVEWRTYFFDTSGIINAVQGAECGIQRIDATNAIRILGPAKVAVSGFVYEITDAYQEVTCPPVASGPPVTYYVSVQYDPALNVAQGDGSANPAGPCRLICSAGPPGNVGNKTSVVLWTVTRSVSQTLTAAPLVDYRRWLGQSLAVGWLRAEINGIGNFTRGTTLYESSSGFSYLRDYDPTLNAGAGGLYWRNMTSPDPVAFPFAGGLVAYDGPPQMIKTGGMVTAQGSLRRTAGGNLDTGADVILGSFPAGWRPAFMRRFACVANSGTQKTVEVNAAGQVTMKAGDGHTVYIDLSAINFQARF